MWQWIQQNIGLQNLVVILLLGSGFLQWIFAQLQAQRAAKKAREAMQASELEALRTGRPTPAQAAPPTLRPDRERRLEEIAAARQKQLEELRRRAAQRRSAQPPAEARPEPTQAVPRDQIDDTQAERRQAEERRRLRQEARARQQAAQRQEAAAQEQALERQAEARREAERRAQLDRADSAARAAAARATAAVYAEPSSKGAPQAAAAAAKLALPAAAFSRSLSPADLRRAIVLREILDAPVALRNPATSGGTP